MSGIRDALTHVLPFPPKAQALHVVAWLDRAERVKLRFDIVDRKKVVIDSMTARMGVKLWRQIVYPLLRMAAPAYGVAFTVHTVEAPNSDKDS